MQEIDTQELNEYLEKFGSLFNDMVKQVVTRNLGGKSGDVNPMFDMEKLSQLIKNSSAKADPAKLLNVQMSLMEKQLALWQNATKAMLGQPSEQVIAEERGDGRFKDSAWTENPVFNYLKQAYLLNSQMLQSMVDELHFDDPKTAERVKFYTRQYVNSVSPSNYALTNPEVCQEILDSKGKNLLKGMENFMRDLENSPAEAFKITQTDTSAFVLGENIAATPGQVIFQNDLIQLIQYSPTTDKVYKKPLLIVPPFINKFYILDLDQKKSLMRWLVQQGYTVFVISWRNADASLADKGFDDYMREGPITALDTIEKVTGESSINVVGYCVGGTLLAATQAHLLAKGDKRINTLTFLTTLLEFSEPGEVGNYLAEEMIPLVEKNADEKGYFDGRIMGLSFSMLRENNLFWSYFISNYLKGQDPAPFDILYWNTDATNIPARCFKYYIRNMYMGNKLVEPGALKLNGTTIDLGIIDTPTYYLAAISDHIVLWQPSYRSAKQFSGPTRFVLGGSGHIAGVINPAEGGKYPHWINEDMPDSAEAWLEGSKNCEGSWWLDWDQWLAPQSGSKVKAREPGCGVVPALEPAPGSYVKVRAEDL